MTLTIYIVVAPTGDRPYVSTTPPSRDVVAANPGARYYCTDVEVPDVTIVSSLQSSALRLVGRGFAEPVEGSGDGGMRQQLRTVTDDDINRATIVARYLNGGREPYAPGIYEIASRIRDQRGGG